MFHMEEGLMIKIYEMLIQQLGSKNIVSQES